MLFITWKIFLFFDLDQWLNFFILLHSPDLLSAGPTFQMLLPITRTKFIYANDTRILILTTYSFTETPYYHFFWKYFFLTQQLNKLIGYFCFVSHQIHKNVTMSLTGFSNIQINLGPLEEFDSSENQMRSCRCSFVLSAIICKRETMKARLELVLVYIWNLKYHFRHNVNDFIHILLHINLRKNGKHAFRVSRYRINY